MGLGEEPGRVAVCVMSSDGSYSGASCCASVSVGAGRVMELGESLCAVS